jgi:hypothetical protein
MITKQKLPKRFKEKWAAALRSGKYFQGKSNLYDSFDNSYCCLGVAANICGVGKDKLNKRSYIEDKVAILADKTKKLPKILYGQKELPEKLANFNDKGKSFRWIAAYIERYL